MYLNFLYQRGNLYFIQAVLVASLNDCNDEIGVKIAFSYMAGTRKDKRAL